MTDLDTRADTLGTGGGTIQIIIRTDSEDVPVGGPIPLNPTHRWDHGGKGTYEWFFNHRVDNIPVGGEPRLFVYNQAGEQLYDAPVEMMLGETTVEPDWSIQIDEYKLSGPLVCPDPPPTWRDRLTAWFRR